MMRQTAPIALVTVLLLLTLVLQTNAQSRDHFTAKEVELIQEAQLLDQRMDVFVRAIERRLIVLNGAAAGNTKQLQKETDKWGELPQGSRAELIDDIAKILDEAITNIDDVSLHDEKSPLLPKALRKLAGEATKLRVQFAPAREQAKSEAEFASIAQLLENAQSILDAATKLPPPSETRTKKKSGKDKDNN